MSELRLLPLRDIAKPGRFGAQTGEVGATLSVIYPLFLATVTTRKGKSKAVASALKSLRHARVMWAGPEQYYVQSPTPIALKQKLGDAASVVDQSHGRVIIRIQGPKSRAILAKGTPVDLYKDKFPLGQSAMTQIAHVGVHITRTGEDEFMLSVFRGFSESLWDWLVSAAGEFGYQVDRE